MNVVVHGPAGDLQAKLWEPALAASSSASSAAKPAAAAVFCHPHPLYGGTMDNKVVFRAARGLQEAGLAVLRFNFRGVKGSQGAHDGHGGEIDDLGAALDWMAARHPGVELWAGGFSFGSRIAAQRALVDPRIARLVLVALPVITFDCSYFARVTQPALVVMADRDEFGTLSELRRRFPDLHRRIETAEIANSGHFFDETGHELQARVREYAERALRGEA